MTRTNREMVQIFLVIFALQSIVLAYQITLRKQRYLSVDGCHSLRPQNPKHHGAGVEGLTEVKLPLNPRMEPQKSEIEIEATAAVPKPTVTSCRKKKTDNATFLEDVKDHIDEFIHASMDEHKSCFTKTIQKMFGMSKIVAERNSEKGVESSLPLQTKVAE